MKYTILKYLFAGSLLVIIGSCKKNNLVVDQDPLEVPSAARFVMRPNIPTTSPYYNYSIAETPSPGSAYKIPVGVTTVSNTDRKVKFSYSSVDAVAGVQYNAPAEITIKAGSVIDTLTIQGLFAGFTAGRKDTLKIKITSGTDAVPNIKYQDSLILIMQKACTPFATNNMLGTYGKTNEDWGGSPYGPYVTSISSITPLTATTATIVVNNIFDYGWNPITFTLDWTDPVNTKVTLVEQSGIGDGATVGFPGEDISVRPFTGQIGSFTNTSGCVQTVQLKLQIGITGQGWFPDLYVVNMAR
jgi:hypothetical protein